MLTTIRDDTWNVLNMQLLTLNSKRWDYSNIPSGGYKTLRTHPSLWCGVPGKIKFPLQRELPRINTF